MMSGKNIDHAGMTKAIVLAAGAVLAAVAAEARTVRVDEFAKADSADDTEAFQKAIDSGADEVVVPNRGRPWVTRPIFGRSNLTMTFEKGAVLEALRGGFKGTADCLVKFDCCTNVILRGYGVTLRMHRFDYHSAPYKRSEWRHGLSFLSCVNVEVAGLSIVESGGDGIYLGVNAHRDAELANFHVVIRDVSCLRNNRQGISVISAEDLLIENCDLSETYGASPEAGIDFEPNRADHRFVDCRLKNCRMRNNMGSGLEVWTTRFDSTTRPVSITMEDCQTECNNEEIRFRDYSRKYGKPKTPPKGTVTVRNCAFRNMRNSYVYAAHETGRGITLKIENCNFVDDPHPERISVKKVVHISDDAPGVLKDITPMVQSGYVGYAICADRAREVRLKAKISKAEPLPTRKGRPVKNLAIAESLPVVDGDGREIASLPLPPGDTAANEIEWRFSVPEAGIYSFGGFANRGVSVFASDIPIAVDVTKSGHMFAKTAGDLYAYVPAGAERLVVTVEGRNSQERVSASIYDPSGTLRGKRTWIESSERYSFRNPEEGMWKFELREPDPGKFGAYGFDMLGGLGYLFLDKNRTWR